MPELHRKRQTFQTVMIKNLAADYQQSTTALGKLAA